MVLSAIDALSRARGALQAAGQRDLADSLTEARKIARRAAMSLHEKGLANV
jgi:hypothetical protein